MVACTAADDAGGFKFGVDGISGLPGAASRSIFGGGRLRRVDTVRIGGGGGSMIRHALAPAACPVGTVPVAVIVPSLLAFLVFTLGGPNLLPARFLPASETAVFVAPVTMTADPEHPATADPPAKPLTQWFFMGPHGGVSGGPESPRQSRASGILSMEDGRCGSSARRKKLDRQRTVGVAPYRSRPTGAVALMTAQSLTVGAHRNAVASMAPCLCIGPLPLVGVFTDSAEAPSAPRTTPGAVRPAP